MVNSCLKCHMDKQSAGFSFQEDDLRDAFKKDPYLLQTFSYRLSSKAGDLRMPYLEENLNENQTKLLMDYLRSFVPQK